MTGARPVLLAGALLLSGAAPAPAWQERIEDAVGRLLAGQVAACRSPPAGVAAATVRPRLRVRLLPDGALDGAPVLLKPSGRPDEAALAASAMRAARRCAPFEGLEPHAGGYERWREVVLDFSGPEF